MIRIHSDYENNLEPDAKFCSSRGNNNANEYFRNEQINYFY